jgi:hypothetical protein
VSFGFRAHTSCTRLDVLLDEFTEARPGIIAADEVNCFVMTRVSKKYVVMFGSGECGALVRWSWGCM